MAVEVISPQPGRQNLFVQSSATEAAFLGQAGGGKSYALILDYLYDYEKPLHNGIIFRKNYRDLEDLISKAHFILDPLGFKFQEQKHLWTAPSGARLWMSHLEQEKEVYAYLGWELSWIGWDQIEQFTPMPYLYMYRSFRCADPTIIKRMRSTANPHGQGAYWVWDRFKNSLAEGEVGYFKTVNGRDVRVNDPADGISRQWFFSDRSENRKLMDADPGYEKNLDMLPTEQLRQAHKFGVLMIADEPDQLIKTEWWESAVNGKNSYIEGQKSFGVDYSEGGDKTVKFDGRGNQVTKVTEWSEFIKHPAMARLLVDDIRDGGIHQMLGGLDTVGTGSGVFTSMQEIDSAAAGRVNPIRYKDFELEKMQEKGAVKLSFQNLQDQIMWKLREDFLFGRIDLSPLVAEQGYYDNLHLLKEEILAFRFMENKLQSGRMWISSSNNLRRASWPGGKPCLGRSPDRAKAFAIWNYVRDWTPESPPMEDKAHRTDYGYKREVKQEEISPYV